MLSANELLPRNVRALLPFEPPRCLTFMGCHLQTPLATAPSAGRQAVSLLDEDCNPGCGDCGRPLWLLLGVFLPKMVNGHSFCSTATRLLGRTALGAKKSHQPGDNHFIGSSILLRLLHKGDCQTFSPFANLRPPTPQFTCYETSCCNQSPFPNIYLLLWEGRRSSFR